MSPLAALVAAIVSGSLYFFPAVKPARSGTLEEEPRRLEKLRSLGAHLSAECAACHENARHETAGRRIGSGGALGVPGISGLDPEVFIRALKDYRDGVRTNPVMASVARSLTEDEMAALAAYFRSAKSKPQKD